LHIIAQILNPPDIIFDQWLEVPAPFRIGIPIAGVRFSVESFVLINLFVFPSVDFFGHVKHRIWHLPAESPHLG
jgi:hypothetical protein